MEDALLSPVQPPKGPDSPPTNARTISSKLLVNKLNYTNFQNGTVLVHLTHRKYNSKTTLPAIPQPCIGIEMHCLWCDPIDAKILEDNTVTGFSLNDGHEVIFVPASPAAISAAGIRFSLPDSCSATNQRRNPRLTPKGIKVKLVQHGAIFDGHLADFSIAAFRVVIGGTSQQNTLWLNPDIPLNVILSGDNGVVFSGECAILKRDLSPYDTLVLRPLHERLSRFKSKRYRSKRQKFVPSPNAIFEHPITGRTTNLKVVDLSGSGLSVEEEAHNRALLPGLIIPALEINFANTFSITCKAQVLYRNVILEKGPSWVKCGLAILDIHLQDHIKLLALITQVDDSHTYMSSKVDPDTLWQFFFETGFIYPKKYQHIQRYKDKIKSIYEKLYYDNPSFARHFTYQKDGNIVAHISMMRFYENSWFIHHHAANHLESKKAGIAVLHQISNSINVSHNLSSSNMQQVLCYYRPDNKFPNRVFGGIARYLKEPKGCSLDTFAYVLYRRKFTISGKLQGKWALTKADSQDLLELNTFYETMSGGLMISALDLEAERAASEGVANVYRDLGLKREKQIFALKKGNKLKAVIIVNITDIGINMSELTSCIKVIIVDTEELETEHFNLSLLLLSSKFPQKDIPVLVYPVSFAQRQGIPYEKLYTLWVLNLQYLDHYFRFCEPLFRTR